MGEGVGKVQKKFIQGIIVKKIDVRRVAHKKSSCVQKKYSCKGNVNEFVQLENSRAWRVNHMYLFIYLFIYLLFPGRLSGLLHLSPIW